MKSSKRPSSQAPEKLQAPMPPQSREIIWVDVRDHLPDDETTVLGYRGNGNTDMVFHADRRWYLEGRLEEKIEVFFWADLPDLPNFCIEHEQKGGAK